MKANHKRIDIVVTVLFTYVTKKNNNKQANQNKNEQQVAEAMTAMTTTTNTKKITFRIDRSVSKLIEMRQWKCKMFKVDK